MTQNFDNRRRAFADVVSIDAWHEPFESGDGVVDLHADIVFGTARVGGEIDSPIRFRLSVKRADVLVIIPPSEPVKIDRRSVIRGAPEVHGHLTETLEQTAEAHAKGQISGSVDAKGIAGGASAVVGASTNISSSKKLEISATVEFMKVTQSKTADDQYRWTIEARRTRTLEGRPWDGVKEPRLKLIDQRKDRTKGIPPTVRVEVRCRREDLIIEDLEVKDETAWQALKGRAGFTNRLAAAESYIRDRLSEEGFEVGNIGDIFSQLTLGSATAESN
jgi:hypothetical protein